MRAAMYLRLSKEGEAPIERQRQDCLGLIKARRWELVGEYVDNLSAFREEVIRPSYVALCDLVAARQVDAVVVYHRDRLWRQVTDQASFVRTARKGGLKLVASVSEGDMDPESPTDKFVSTILAAHAEMSSEDTRRRVRRLMVSLAEQGKPKGGGYRAFGYQRDGLEIVEAEAELIREAVADLLGGGSIAGIVTRWNEAGIVSTAGNRWQRTALRNLLLRPRIAGIRQHQGQPIRPAVWPAIVSEDDWRAVGKLLSDRDRNTGQGQPRALLAGVAVCGRCGARLGTEPPRFRQDGRRLVPRLYACRHRSDGGCRGLAIRADLLDAEVERRMFEEVDSGRLEAALRRREAAAAKVDTDAVLAQLDADRALLVDLQRDLYERKTMERRVFLELEAPILERIGQAERTLDEVPNTAGLRAVTDARFRKAWDAKAGDLRWRRQVVRAVFEKIEVLPSPTRGGRFFDPARVVTVTF